MMRKEQKRQYLKLENTLQQKFETLPENELTVVADDFKSDEHSVSQKKLRASAFNRLKEECWYIPYEEEVVLRVPIGMEIAFKASLEFRATRELSKLKKDRREDCVQSALLLAIGMLILGALALTGFLWEGLSNLFFVTELITIASWAFIWAAVHKFFIDRIELSDARFTLLQLVSARVESYKQMDSIKK